MFIWYSSSQCGTLLSSYQCIFVKSHHRIELASNAKASCCFWPLVRFFRGSKISCSRQWSLVAFFRRLSCCLWSLAFHSCWHLAVLEAEEALTFIFHLISYWSLVVNLLFNWSCGSIFKKSLLLRKDYKTYWFCQYRSPNFLPFT